LAVASGALLAGCGSTKPPAGTPEVEEIQLDISVISESDANSDIKGRGAPLVLRIYELKSEAIFEDAEFFALQDQDKSTLGSDLLKTDSWILKPGESRNIRRRAHTETRAIGIFAAYRDLPNATWRVVRPMAAPPETHWYRALAATKKVRFTVRAQSRGLLVVEPETQNR